MVLPVLGFVALHVPGRCGQVLSESTLDHICLKLVKVFIYAYAYYDFDDDQGGVWGCGGGSGAVSSDDQSMDSEGTRGHVCTFQFGLPAAQWGTVITKHGNTSSTPEYLCSA